MSRTWYSRSRNYFNVFSKAEIRTYHLSDDVQMHYMLSHNHYRDHQTKKQCSFATKIINKNVKTFWGQISPSLSYAERERKGKVGFIERAYKTTKNKSVFILLSYYKVFFIFSRRFRYLISQLSFPFRRASHRSWGGFRPFFSLKTWYIFKLFFCP